MEKKLFVLSLFVSSTFATVAHANTTLNFTGAILDQACTVNTNQPTITVNLGNVSSDAFATAVGSTISATKFDIILSNCPDTMNSVSVKFDGAAHATNPNLLAITPGVDSAGGVGIAIYEANSTTLIPIATNSATKPLIPNADTNLTFIAKYMKTSPNVTAGTANAVGSFTISYN